MAHQEVQELVHNQVTAVEAEFDRLVTAIGDKYAASSATESYVIGLIEDTFGEGDDRRQKAVDHYRARVEEFKTFPRREAENNSMSINDKATTLLAEKRVQVMFASDGLVQAKVRGDHGVYDVRWTRNQGWDCTCAAFGECSHREAIRSVVMRSVGR